MRDDRVPEHQRASRTNPSRCGSTRCKATSSGSTPTRCRARWRPTSCWARAAALAELGLERARVGFDDLRLALHVAAELPALNVGGRHRCLARTSARSRRRRRSSSCATVRRSTKPDCATSCRRSGRGAWKRRRDAVPQSRAGSAAPTVLSAQKALQFGAEYGGEYFPDLMFAGERLESARRAGDHFRDLGHVFELRVRCLADRARRRAERRVPADLRDDLGGPAGSPCSTCAPASRTHEAWAAISEDRLCDGRPDTAQDARVPALDRPRHHRTAEPVPGVRPVEGLRARGKHRASTSSSCTSATRSRRITSRAAT